MTVKKALTLDAVTGDNEYSLQKKMPKMPQRLFKERKQITS